METASETGTRRARARTMAALPAERAFVVQYAAGTTCAGRVEHVVSGQSTRFQSTEDLHAFMLQVLSRLHE